MEDPGRPGEIQALEFLDHLAAIFPPPRIHRHRYHGVFAPNGPLRPLITARAREDNAPRWAVLFARIYEVVPLTCPSCQIPLTFIAFLTDPEPITQILAHIGEPTSPPPPYPARGPPQTEFLLDIGDPEPEAVAREYLPDNFDQSPEFDPAEPESVPDDDFDQSRDW